MLANPEVATRPPAKDLTRALFESAAAAAGAHTQMAWEVADIQATVAPLRRRGVVFEEYGLPGLGQPVQ